MQGPPDNSYSRMEMGKMNQVSTRNVVTALQYKHATEVKSFAETQKVSWLFITTFGYLNRTVQHILII